MNNDDSSSKVQVLKCPECSAKINPDDIHPGTPIICEYCGAIVFLPQQMKPQAAHAHPPGRRPVQRFLGRRAPRGVRRPVHAPLLRAVNLLANKGAIDRKTLRKYTKRNLDKRMRPPAALRTALKQMRDDGKLKRDKVMHAVDELIAEQKLKPRARETVERLFS
jgi:DNA-directed RNA polymerase subunit RPC12/RpoP